MLLKSAIRNYRCQISLKKKHKNTTILKYKVGRFCDFWSGGGLMPSQFVQFRSDAIPVCTLHMRYGLVLFQFALFNFSLEEKVDSLLAGP